MTIIDHAFLSGLVDGENINVRYRFINEHGDSVIPAIVVMGVVALKGGRRTIALPQVNLFAVLPATFQVQILTMGGRIIVERALDLPLLVAPGSYVCLRHFVITVADT